MATQALTWAREDFLHNHGAKLCEKTTPDVLSNAQHAALRKKLDTIDFVFPVWSSAT